jgi:hypothetical protein
MGKPKTPKQKPPETMKALAERLGVSRQLVGKLFSRGYSVAEIEARIQLRRSKEEAHQASGKAPVSTRVNGKANGHDHDMDFPTVPVPSFAESEKRKEFFLSEIRRAEAAKLHSTLLPLEPLRSVVFASTQYLSNRLRDLPDELADQFGPENTKLLRIRIYAVVDEARRVLVWESQRHGIPVPPDPPPQVRKRLGHYEQFLKGSTTGETQRVSGAKEIGSPEWMAQHPSVSFQESFKYSRLKKEWDERMLQLLAERSSWDLPSELPDQPPPIPPEKPDEAA